MSQQNHISLAEIARDLRAPWFRAELRSSWAVAVLYRVPSLPVVWLAARLGFGPTSVTLAALLLALSFPLQAMFLPPSAAAWTVALSAILFQVLDCTDGTLARVTGRSTQRGADLDFLVDMAQWGALYLAIGILADRTLGTGFGWSLVAVIAVWIRLYGRVVSDRLTADARPPVAPAAFRLVRLPVMFVEGLSGLIPFLALSGAGLWLAVLFLLVYAILDLAVYLLPLIEDAG